MTVNERKEENLNVFISSGSPIKKGKCVGNLQ